MNNESNVDEEEFNEYDEEEFQKYYELGYIRDEDLENSEDESFEDNEMTPFEELQSRHVYSIDEQLNFDNMQRDAGIRLSQINNFLDDDTNAFSREYQSVYLSSLISDHCLTSPLEFKANELTDLLEMFDKSYGVNDEELLGIHGEWTSREEKTSTSPDGFTKQDIAHEKEKARLLSIAYFNKDIDCNMEPVSFLDNSLSISYHKYPMEKATKLDYSYLQNSSDERYHNIEEFRQKLLSLITYEGELPKNATQQEIENLKESQAISSLPLGGNCLDTFINYQLINQDTYNNLNVGTDSRLISALILNFATLDGIRTNIFPDFDANVNRVHCAKKENLSRVIAEAFDSNYNLVMSNPKISTTLIKLWKQNQQTQEQDESSL